MNRAPGKKPRNVGASVRDRLTQRARANTENVQLLLTRYAIERLLYRLSASPHRDRFILKGAMLFSLWAPTPYRATGDLDLLGYGDAGAGAIVAAFRQISTADVPDDGVTVMPDTVQAAVARAEDEYNGLRVTLQAVIAGARLPMQVDIGFGKHREIVQYRLTDRSLGRGRMFPFYIARRTCFVRMPIATE